MALKKWPVIAFSAVLSFVACSDDGNPVTQPDDGGIPYGGELPDPGLSSSLGLIPGSEFSSSSVVNPGFDFSSSSVVGPVPGFSSSSNVFPGMSSAVVPGSSATVFPGSSESGDDDNDNEDARTLNGSQILLKVSGTTATVENNNGCVEIADKVATITCPGAYYLTGESSDFQVVVNTPAAEKEGNTGIYLHNVTLKSSNSPILVKNADKAVIHLVKGTTNVVEDGNGNHLFTTVNGKQDTAKAAIYSKDDMNIKGAGKLTVNGKFKNGIQSSNDLKIKNGDITVVANENGIKGKGSLEISGGTLSITAQKGDGLESDECVENHDGSFKDTVATKGIVKISGGNITIKAGDDGIDAANYILVSDSTEPATLNIKATGKGLAAEKYIYVNGGTMEVNSDDDALHTHWRVYMNAGKVTVSSKDDGLHADSAMYLKGSTINVLTASEGIEAYRIFAEGGITSVFATNDGWNGAGGPKDPNGGGYSAFSESGGHIVISGGYHYISAKGSMIDVLDANGSAKMSGGVVILEITGESYENGMGGGFNFGGWGGGMGGGGGCSQNMAGGLIDTDTGFEITGGVLLAFGNYSTDLPKCATVTYDSNNYYGTNNAAFKPTYKGNAIIYGGEVSSVAQVQVNGMQELKFPNGVSYMYK